MLTKLLPLSLIHTTTQQKETTRPLTRSTQATTVVTATTVRDPLSLFHSKDQVWEHLLPPRFIRLFLLMSPILGIAAAATAAALVVVVAAAAAAAAHPAAPTHATTQVQVTVILQSTRVQLGAPAAEVNG